MRVVAAMAALGLIAPAIASAQVFEVHGSAGPTVTDAGYSVSAGVGVSPVSRLTFMVDVEHIRLATRVRTDARGNTTTSGGRNVTLGEAIVRVSLFGTRRIDPYAIVGVAAGVSRPNATAAVPNRGAIDVVGPFAGGGFQAPVNARLSIFVDGRMMVVAGTEEDELIGAGSIRAGIRWRL